MKIHAFYYQISQIMQLLGIKSLERLLQYFPLLTNLFFHIILLYFLMGRGSNRMQ